MTRLAVVSVVDVLVNAHAALDTVHIARLLSESADATGRAMEDLLSLVVFPQLAYGAVVSDGPLVMTERARALGANGLDGLAPHADHLLRREPVHGVGVLLHVVTQPAGIPPATADGLDLEAPLIVRTAQHLVGRVVIGRFYLLIVLLKPRKRESPVESHVVLFRLLVGDDADAQLVVAEILPQLLVVRHIKPPLAHRSKLVQLLRGQKRCDVDQNLVGDLVEGTEGLQSIRMLAAVAAAQHRSFFFRSVVLSGLFFCGQCYEASRSAP